MTKQEALAKAKELWGNTAAVEHNPKSEFGTHSVGNIITLPVFGAAFNCLGSGDSFEAAFKQVEERGYDKKPPFGTRSKKQKN